MNLYEFFSKPNVEKTDQDTVDGYDPTKIENTDRLENDLYFHILDDNYLHKKYFLPLATEVKRAHKSKKFKHNDFVAKWMPMVNAGCQDFYKNKSVDGDVINGDPKEIFNKKLRIRVCRKLAKQFHEDIIADEYQLGESVITIVNPPAKSQIINESNTIVLYIDNKPAASYTDSNKARDEMMHLKRKFPSKRFVLKKEICTQQTIDELEESKKSNPCWKGYKQIGMKKKGNKKVPNCVPVSEDVQAMLTQYISILEAKNKKATKIAKHASAAIPNGKNYKQMDSYYDLYRFGVAMAGQPDNDSPVSGPVGHSPSTYAYSHGDKDIITAAEKNTNNKGVYFAKGHSKEVGSAHTISPTPDRSKLRK